MPSLARMIEKYGQVYVRLKDNKTGREFMKDAKELGATFMDGTELKPRYWGHHMGIGRERGTPESTVGYLSAVCLPFVFSEKHNSYPVIDYRKFKDKKIDYMIKSREYSEEKLKEISSNIFGDFLVPPVSVLTEKYGEVWFYLENKKAAKGFIKELNDMGATLGDEKEIKLKKWKKYMKVDKNLNVDYVSDLCWDIEYRSPEENIPLIHYRKFKDMELDYMMKITTYDDEVLRDIMENIMD